MGEDGADKQPSIVAAVASNWEDCVLMSGLDINIFASRSLNRSSLCLVLHNLHGVESISNRLTRRVGFKGGK